MLQTIIMYMQVTDPPPQHSQTLQPQHKVARYEYKNKNMHPQPVIFLFTSHSSSLLFNKKSKDFSDWG